MSQQLDSRVVDLSPKKASESATEMVQVVLPNDANPLGFILGGTVMHLIDIAGAIACHRHQPAGITHGFDLDTEIMLPLAITI